MYVWMELTRLNDWQAVRDDHRAIVGAIAAGDAEAACQQTRRHIQESRDGILNLMLRQRGLRGLYQSRTGEK